MNREQIEALSVEEKISYLATRHMLTISQWDDKWKHYRVGINWDYHRDNGKLDFLIESPTLDEALNDVMEYTLIGIEEWQKLHAERKKLAA